MTEEDFIQLLLRFEKGLCTPEEKARIEQWLDGMAEGGNPFKSESEKAGMKAALRESIYRKGQIHQGRRAVLTASFWMRAAAAILVLVSVSFALLKLESTGTVAGNVVNMTRSTDTVEKVLLSDGSIIWLKPNSRLTYPETFEGSARIVTLEGEALFEVRKDPERPFVIHSGGLTTRVLGTSFNIRNTSQGTEVYVLTGKVSVTLDKTNQKIELLPAEKVSYAHADNRLQKEQVVPDSAPPEAYTEGTEYNMSFQDTKLTEIASRIENRFNVKVVVKGGIQSCVVTADLTDQSLNSTLDIISEALNATFEIDNGEVILEGGGCDNY